MCQCLMTQTDLKLAVEPQLNLDSCFYLPSEIAGMHYRAWCNHSWRLNPGLCVHGRQALYQLYYFGLETGSYVDLANLTLVVM